MNQLFLFPTAPHDGGALFPDDSGDRKSGHATAYVSRQYLGSRGQVRNGIDMAGTSDVRAARGNTAQQCGRGKPPSDGPRVNIRRG